MKNLLVIGALALALALAAAACGSDDDNGSTSDEGSAASGEAPTVDDMSPEELEIWQADLNAVGCYVGAVDGSLGPQTEAAISAFQAAQGLTVDGTLGPETEGALEEAVAAGTIVCTTTTDGESGGGGAASTASLSSATYSKSFAIGSCSLNADVSNVSIQGESDGLTLVVDASEGTGSLAVSGGTESDGITLNGSVTAVNIGSDRSYAVTGEFAEPNNVGETFSLTGACPE